MEGVLFVLWTGIGWEGISSGGKGDGGVRTDRGLWGSSKGSVGSKNVLECAVVGETVWRASTNESQDSSNA